MGKGEVGGVNDSGDQTPPAAVTERGESPVIRAFRRFIDHRYTGAAIIALIVVSVILTVYEFSIPEDQPLHHTLAEVSHLITFLFVIELVIRFCTMRRPERFLREYWLDVLAVLPFFRIFRLFRAFRLLRLLRLLRLFRVGRLIHRHVSSLPQIFRRSAVEYTVLACFVLFTIIAGASAMLTFEQHSPGGEFATFEQTLWWSIYTLLAGESVTQFPDTLAGRIVAATVMFLGLGVFALLTGTVSAVMVERLKQLERMPMELDDLRGHIVVCGYSRKVPRILDEILADDGDPTQAIVLVADAEHQESMEALRQQHDRVLYTMGDFTRMEVLRAAGADRCRTCIIVSDLSGHRTEQDADARTILGALTLEKMNPEAFTCAELQNSDYISHLEAGGVDDVVIGGEHSSLLLAHAAITQGLGDVVSELLTNRRGSQFYKLEVPEHLAGQSFAELLALLQSKHHAILLGYQRDAGPTHVNPADYQARAGDQLIVIASRRVTL